MALHIKYKTSYFGSYSTLNLVTAKVGQIKLHYGYSGPSSLSFVCYQPQHTYPLIRNTFLKFWDDSDVTQSESAPIFEGWVEEIEPIGSNEIGYTCYDPTRRSANRFGIMSHQWQDASDLTGFPLPGLGSYPRLVFNSKIDNDDDYAFERGHDLTVGNMIATILEDCLPPLYFTQATSGDGTTPTGYNLPYVSGDLDAMTFKPQEKEVFESDNVRSALERLLRYYPTWKLLWYPGVRKWRFGDVTASPQYTLTLNDPNATYPVLSMQLHRSFEKRHTAVWFFGPETSYHFEASLGAGTLTDLSAPEPVLQNNIATCCDVPCKSKWQITFVSDRRVSRMLPEPYPVQISDYQIVWTRAATLQGYWPATSAGSAGWRPIYGWHLDAQAGILDLTGACVYRYNPSPAGGQPNYENPTDIKFVYGLYDNPIQVRYPSSSFAGSAYTIAGLESELQIYDEMLSVGYEWNQPVTSAARLAQYQILAQYLHKYYSDIVYTGGLTLEGIKYDWAPLNARINLAAVDANGDPLTTGWEDINAILTDVEFDYDQNITTLTFSSDHLSLLGIDMDLLKKRLKIKALKRRESVSATMKYTIRNRRIGEQAYGFSSQWNVHEMQINVDHRKWWEDDQGRGEEIGDLR